jgi:hypothetical protein
MTQYYTPDSLERAGQCPIDGSKTDVVGIELEGVYDGVCFWTCFVHDISWHRFTPPGRVYDAAQNIFDEEKNE